MANESRAFQFERGSRGELAQGVRSVLAAGVGEVAQVAVFGAGVEEQQGRARDREVADDVGVAASGFVLEQRAVAAVVVARLDPPVVADVGRPLAGGARAGVQRAECIRKHDLRKNINDLRKMKAACNELASRLLGLCRGAAKTLDGRGNVTWIGFDPYDIAA